MPLDEQLLPDRPRVRRDPIDEQPGGEPVQEEHEDDRQHQHDAALVGICRRGRHQRRGDLRGHVQEDQDDQRGACGLVRDVGQEQKLRRVRRDAVAARFFDVFARQMGDGRYGRVVEVVVVVDQARAADVLLQVAAQHVEQRDEDRQLQQQRQARRERVDFVLAVEVHDLLLLALFVVLVLLFQRLDMRGQALHLLHGLQLPERQRNQQRPDDHRQTHDRQSPTAAHQVVVDEHHDRFEHADQRRERVLDDVGEGEHAR